MTAISCDASPNWPRKKRAGVPACRRRLVGHRAGAPEELEVPLDQCWDLLRQRRAQREMGGAPDAATIRPEEVVERDLQ